VSSTASGLIKTEIGRLKARKAYLETGLPEHQKQFEVQQQCIQSLNDEIRAISNTLDELHAACRRLDRK
jgi:hypothetical protein